MANAAKWWTFSQNAGLNQRAQPLLGGNNGFVLESENLSFFQEGAVVQRFGSPSQSLTGSDFTGIIEWLGRFTTLGGVEELWGAANNAGSAALARRPGGSWSPVTFSDTVNVLNLRYMQAASLTSKYFIAYDSNVNRLHVWDGTSLRRAGFAPATNVTVATLGGSGITGTRWYRMRYVELSGSTVVRRSEPSPVPVSLALVDDAGWQVTKGAAISEGETHWEVEAADAEAGPWYRIAQVVVGTTTYDDTSATIDTTNLSDILGSYIPPPSAKYIITDTNRLLMAGAWESSTATGQTAVKQNRVWFTPVLGSTDEGDDERIPNTVDQQNWTDVGNEGPITGLAGPLFGDIFVFKADSVFKLTATGDVTTPYRVLQVSGSIGCVDQRVVTVGETGDGAPALFFASAGSAYSVTSGGITEITDQISRDLRLNNFTASSSWLAFNPYDKSIRVQTNSGTAELSGQYYQFAYDLKSKQWTGISFAGGSSSWILGRGLLGVDTILGGDDTTVIATVVAKNDNGSVRLHFGGQNVLEESLLMAAGDACGVDGPDSFTSKLRVRKYPMPGYKFRVGCPTVIYRSPTGTTGVIGTLMVSYLRQDDEIVTKSYTMEATDTDNPVQQHMVTFDGMDQADLGVLDVRFTLSYDGSFVSSVPPSIDAFMIPVWEQETYAV